MAVRDIRFGLSARYWSRRRQFVVRRIDRDAAVRLTELETNLFIALVAETGRGRLLSRGEIAEVLWPDPDDSPEAFWTAIAVHIFNLRRKIRLLGLDVGVTWGRGYNVIEIASGG